MGAWISAIGMLLIYEAIYRASTYLLNLEGGIGPPFSGLLIATICANFLGSWIYMLSRKQDQALPDTENPERVALLSLAEEGLRAIVFGVTFSVLAGVNHLLGYQSISYHIHPWIDRLGWPGIWAALISSVVFTTIHVRKNGTTSGFLPIIPSILFTLALINHGVLAAAVLHLVYNGEGMAWLALRKRCLRSV
jgi:hypothetical protein